MVLVIGGSSEAETRCVTSYFCSDHDPKMLSSPVLHFLKVS